MKRLQKLVLVIAFHLSILGCAREEPAGPKGALQNYLSLVEAGDWTSMAALYALRAHETPQDLSKLEGHLEKRSETMKDLLKECIEQELPADATEERVVFKPWENAYFEIARGEDGVWRWRW